MHSIQDANQALKFALSGNATITLKSVKTGRHFTYRIRAFRKEGSYEYENPIRFVEVLTGPDNERSYQYIGYIRDEKFYHGGIKAKVGMGAPSVMGFQYGFRFLFLGNIPENLEVYHEGKCGRCGRKLTTPESIQSGLGPVCRGE